MRSFHWNLEMHAARRWIQGGPSKAENGILYRAQAWDLERLILRRQGSIFDMQFYVYILASKPRGTLYIGVTRDLVNRVWQHKSDMFEGFSKRYGVHTLVWYESTSYLQAAIQKEKQLKLWHRAWKIRLIERTNPEWRDLFKELI